LKNPARTDFIITERESSTPIGIVGISIVCGTGEISYIIGESAFLRRGFATEAINAIVKQFSNKVTNFSAEIHPKNIASAKTVEKCGFIQARESEFLLYERKGEQ
jgi:RimJ/RimL family protein N-acetyltransferase